VTRFVGRRAPALARPAVLIKTIAQQAATEEAEDAEDSGGERGYPFILGHARRVAPAHYLFLPEVAGTPIMKRFKASASARVGQTSAVRGCWTERPRRLAGALLVRRAI